MAVAKESMTITFLINDRCFNANTVHKKTIMKIYRNLLSTVLVFFLISGLAVMNAQSSYRLSGSQAFKVSGTSTLHDWDMSSENATGEAVIVFDGNEIKDITALTINLPVKTLKSGNNRLDRTAYSTLEADKNENVKFELTGVRNITPQTILATGRLTIAGQTRPVTLRTDYVVNGKSIKFTGSHSIKFSQFDVEAPTVLLGTVKTGDELEFSFSVNMSPGVTASR
jgi:polyisoprenoid-binding protein YceI